MIAEKVVQEVRRLLAEGTLSQRKIAQQTGVCRGTVSAIASGKRPDYRLPDWMQDEEEEHAGPPVRCGGCGGLVYLPCQHCRTQKILAKEKRPRPNGGFDKIEERIELNLRPDHRARYEEVLAWRRAQGVA
jgi:transcriptional regulator with XRE-family HTH domain